MQGFLFALQFLTIIPFPVKVGHEEKMSGSLVYFPVVGLLLGLILSGINTGFSVLKFDAFSINIILVIALTVLTGGIHLDGVSDTCDALWSRKSKEEMLRIMRDPHVGVMGVLGIISIILLKISLLSSISLSLKNVSLILMCVFSRWSLVLAMFSFPYARQEGKTKIFLDGLNFRKFVLATLITLSCAIFIWQLRGVLINALIFICAYAISKFINRRIGGITGDTLGAMNEIIELITLFSICIMERGQLWIG